jgi:hypothetical protein
MSRAFTDHDPSQPPSRQGADGPRNGRTFTGILQSEIVFDGLTKEELGGLLASVDPSLLLQGYGNPGAGERQIATHLGGGKPLGLGSVRPTILSLQVSGPDRYAEQDPPNGESDDDWTPAAVVAEFANVAGNALDNQWLALAHVLDLEKVDPDLVWYPPGADRSHIRKRGQHERRDPFKTFQESFRFFQKADGHAANAHGQGGADIVPLPDPIDPDQSLHINPQAKGKGPGQ